MTGFDRITFDPTILSGRACIRGMRITVAMIVNLISNGMTSEEIVREYPYLELADIQQSLRYVAMLADESIRELEQVAP